MKKKRFIPKLFFFFILLTLVLVSIFSINNFVENNYDLDKVVKETKTLPNFVNLNDIPKDLQNAFISIEDQRFYSHIGIDPIAIVGSFKDNLQADKIVRGGSTITQQLSKNLYLTGDKTIERKVVEAMISLKLNFTFSKEDVLQSYLNRINLGNGSFGVNEASMLYFSKDVKELNTAQCALIASITKSPENLAPFTKVSKSEYKSGDIIKTFKSNKTYYLVLNESSFERQRIVLMKMLELKYIDENQYKKALDFDIKSSLKPNIPLIKKLGG